MTEPNSQLVDAIAARQRTCHDVYVPIRGADGKPVGTVRMRVATKAEQDAAVAAAHRYIADRAGDAPGAKEDADIVTEAKAVHILHQVCRDAEHPEMMAAFPSPRWMMDHLTVDELGVLLNSYNAIVASESPMRQMLSDEQVEALAAMCVNGAASAVPNLVLAHLDRDALAEFAVRMALRMPGPVGG